MASLLQIAGQWKRAKCVQSELSHMIHFLPVIYVTTTAFHKNTCSQHRGAASASTLIAAIVGVASAKAE
jgi:hypothetical protein